MTLSQTLDQVGGFAAAVDAAARIRWVMAGTDLSPSPPGRPPRLGLYRSLSGPSSSPRRAIASICRSSSYAPPARPSRRRPHLPASMTRFPSSGGSWCTRPPPTSGRMWPGRPSSSARIPEDGRKRREDPEGEYRAALAERQRLMAGPQMGGDVRRHPLPAGPGGGAPHAKLAESQARWRSVGGTAPSMAGREVCDSKT